MTAMSSNVVEVIKRSRNSIVLVCKNMGRITNIEIPSISDIMVNNFQVQTDYNSREPHTMVKNKILYILDVLHSFM
jgi:hypothetical protein